LVFAANMHDTLHSARTLKGLSCLFDSERATNLQDNVSRGEIQLRDGEGGEAEWNNDMGPF
jgi:hypothetical protein